MYSNTEKSTKTVAKIKQMSTISIKQQKWQITLSPYLKAHHNTFVTRKQWFKIEEAKWTEL